MVKVKICGITNRDDALTSVEYGADGIGFIFYKESPRYISPEQAGEIISSLPPLVTTFGVFVNADEDEIREVVEDMGIDIIQFHGDEPPDLCRRFKERAIKAIRIKNRESLRDIEKYDVRGFLLDTYHKKGYGGTGERFDWDIAIEAKEMHRYIIISGGITVENVREAVERIMPYGVDVSSGVEIGPGRKDNKKIREFIRRAKGINHAL